MAVDPNLTAIKFFRSKTANAKPTIAQISEGELAFNMTDRTIFTNNGTSIVELGFGKGGNVAGTINQTNGNFTTGGFVKALRFEGSLVGNADTSSKLQTARTITLENCAYGSVDFDGSSNVNLNVTVERVHSFTGRNKFENVPNTAPVGLSVDRVAAEDGWPSYGTVLTARGLVNSGVSGGGGTLQLYTPYNSQYGGTSLRYRSAIYGSTTYWSELKTIVDSANFNAYAPKLDGTGATGTWNISISGKSATSALADAATKLAKPVLIGGSAFDGTKDIEITTPSFSGWLANFTTGGDLNTTGTDTGVSYKYVNASSANRPAGFNIGTLTTLTYSNAANVAAVQQAHSFGNSESYVRSKATGGSYTNWRRLLNDFNFNEYAPKLDGTGATGTWNISISGKVTGNADTASALQNARQINGTLFNGTQNITTANWGSARSILIGKTTRTVNGSGNYSWTLADMGAVDKAGDTMTGGLLIQGGAGDKPLQVRGITGLNTDYVTTGPLYLQFSANQPIMLGNGGGYNISANGGQYSGNSATATLADDATKLKTARTISLTGDSTGSVSFDGSSNVSINVTNPYLANNQGSGKTFNDISNENRSQVVIWGSSQPSDKPSRFNAVKLLNLGIAQWPTQLALNAYTNDGAIRTKTAQGAWQDWRYLAFEDSNITGNAGSATKLETARTIGISGTSGASGSVTFDGTGNALIPLSVVTQPVTANNPTIATTAFVQAVNSAETGSAAIAVKLKTAQNIGITGSGASGSISFDGTKPAIIPLTVATQATTNNSTMIATTAFVQAVNTSGTAIAAKLKTAVPVGGVMFDGSTGINLPGVNQPGNQDTSGRAAVATFADTAEIAFRADSLAVGLKADQRLACIAQWSGVNFTQDFAVALYYSNPNEVFIVIEKNIIGNIGLLRNGFSTAALHNRGASTNNLAFVQPIISSWQDHNVNQFRLNLYWPNHGIPHAQVWGLSAITYFQQGCNYRGRSEAWIGDSVGANWSKEAAQHNNIVAIDRVLSQRATVTATAAHGYFGFDRVTNSVANTTYYTGVVGASIAGPQQVNWTYLENGKMSNCVANITVWDYL